VVKSLSLDVGEALVENNVIISNGPQGFLVRLLDEAGPFSELKFHEFNGVRTLDIEIKTIKFQFGGITRKNLELKVFNSDGSVEIVTVSSGKFVSLVQYTIPSKK
jgi:hypothetical protein